MEFAEWEPVYEAVLADMGYSRAADERARDVLADLVEPFEVAALPAGLGGTVAVAGAGPDLEAEADRAAGADAVVAASTAAERLRSVGVGVDLVTTDLDESSRAAVRLSRDGVVTVVHAHGDNLPAVRSVVPDCAPAATVGTTQAAPVGPVRNFGGFTDGDRGAFLADQCGADRLVFPGWAFDDPSVRPEKRRKLRWAERLLYWLERRRGERFAVLDGRRSGIDTGDLPVD